MDGVERALGGAQAAADALVGVDDRGAAVQAAGGLGAHLLFGWLRPMVSVEPGCTKRWMETAAS